MVCLVLLRLAIGWHFLFEGIEKVRTLQIGPSERPTDLSVARVISAKRKAPWVSGYGQLWVIRTRKPMIW